MENILQLIKDAAQPVAAAAFSLLFMHQDAVRLSVFCGNWRFRYCLNMVFLFSQKPIKVKDIMRRSTYFFIFFLTPFFSYANQDSIRVNSYLKKAKMFLRSGAIDSFEIYRNKTLSFYEKEDDLLAWLDASSQIGRVYRKEMDAPFRTIEYYKSIERDIFRSPNSKKEWIKLGWIYANIGKAYLDGQSDVENAIKLYKKAESVFKEKAHKEDFEVAWYIYSLLGNLNTMKGDYEKSIYYLKKVKSFCIKEKRWENAAHVSNNLALALHWKNNFNEAIKEYLFGLAYENLTPSTQCMLLNNLAVTYMQLNDFESAKKKLNQVGGILKKSKQDENFYDYAAREKDYVHNMGIYYYENFDFEKSKNYFLKTIELHEGLSATENLRGVAKVQIQLGEVFLKNRDYYNALEQCQIALEKMLLNFKPKDKYGNPTHDLFYPENTIAQAFVLKAKTLEQLYLKEKKDSHLITAVECYELMLAVWQQLRSTYNYESSHHLVLEENREHLEKAIDLSYLLWKITSNEIYLKKAFRFSQQAKNLLLLESMQEVEATIAAGVPDTLLEQQKELDLKLTWLQKQLLNKKEEKDDGKINDLKTQIFNVKESLLKLDERLETYPKYANLKNEWEIPEIDKLKDSLPHDGMLLDYFVGDSALYVSKISKNKFDVKKINKNFPLEKLVDEMRRGIYGHKFGEDYNACIELYVNAAHQLYAHLLKPMENDLLERLIIIPDGILGYIPFEALLTEPTDSPKKFRSHNYLLIEKTISYNYSAALWLKMKSKKVKGNKLLAVAPAFGKKQNNNKTIAERRSELGQLIYNDDEVYAIHEIMGGDTLIGSNATKEQFRKYARQYNILHLATHAILDERESKLSYIAFSGADENGDTEKIYLLDLYNYHFPLLDMVVLSACETGIGELQKGEGIISLARGFTSTGAKSIITSLWEISDKPTAPLMADFYEQLKKGKNKAEALYNAKNNYLKNKDNDPHPFYWASFIAVGDMSAVEVGHSFSFLYWGLLSCVFLLIGIYFFRKRNL